MKLLTILIALLIAGCGPAMAPQKLVGTEVREYELVGRTVPKHFYVDLKDTQTGGVRKHVYVSKHCNSHYKLVNGTKYKLTVNTYERTDAKGTTTRTSEIVNLYSTFCG